jgi:hypothetical protein
MKNVTARQFRKLEVGVRIPAEALGLLSESLGDVGRVGSGQVGNCPDSATTKTAPLLNVLAAVGLFLEIVRRFEARVDRSGECHEWTGGLQTRGYGWLGTLRIGSGLAHRFAWELAKGLIPDGLTIDHCCRNKRCVRVEHMELVTREENTRRRWTWRTESAAEVSP